MILTISESASGSTSILVSRYIAFFILKFTQYIYYNKNSLMNEIGVLGHTGVYSNLEKMILFRKDIIKLHPQDSVVALTSSDIVFFSEKPGISFGDVVNRLKHPSLLVTMGADCLRYGADISFYFEDNRLRFYLNQRTIESKGLIVEGHLRSMASIFRA